MKNPPFRRGLYSIETTPPYSKVVVVVEFDKILFMITSNITIYSKISSGFMKLSLFLPIFRFFVHGH